MITFMWKFQDNVNILAQTYIINYIVYLHHILPNLFPDTCDITHVISVLTQELFSEVSPPNDGFSLISVK
jgi:hypothetical protein